MRNTFSESNNYKLLKEVRKLSLFVCVLILSNATCFAQTLSDLWVVSEPNGCKLIDQSFIFGMTYKWDGPCHEDKSHGFGKLTVYYEGEIDAIYEGTYNMGVREGKGTLSLTTGLIHKGTFVEGYLSGYGKVEDKNYTYQGNLIRGEIHGEGEQKLVDGTLVKGYFTNGELYTGTIYVNDGRAINVCKKEVCDKLVPEGQNYNPPFNTLITEYFDIFWQRCDSVEAQYFRKITYQKNNKPKGAIKDYFISGNLCREYGALYVDNNDQRKNFYEGQWKEYYDNEKPTLKKSAVYIHNKISGIERSYYENGQPETTTEYYQGRRDGEFKAYYENGKIKIEGKYDFDELLDYCNLFIDDGKLLRKIEKEDIKEIEKSFNKISTKNEDLVEARLFGDFLFYYYSKEFKNQNVNWLFYYIAKLNSEVNQYSKAVQIIEHSLNNVCLYDTINNILLQSLMSFIKLHQKEYLPALYFSKNVLQMYEFKNQSELEFYVKILKNYSDICNELGFFNDAILKQKEILNLNDRILGKNHPAYSTSLNNLAESYSRLGNYEEALKLHQESLELKGVTLGKNHPDYIISLNNLGSNYSALGQYEKALELKILVAEKRKEVFGENHLEYIRSLNNLASSYAHVGQFDKAIALNLKAREKIKIILGESHPDYLMSSSNLASFYLEKGEYEKALAINNEIAEKRKEILGEDHPDYLRSLNDLGSTYSLLGQHNKALEIELKVVEKQKALRGNSHPEYLKSLNNLALTYFYMGQYLKAKEKKLEVLYKRKEILGEDHPDYLIDLNDISSMYSNIGQYDKALKIKIEIGDKLKSVLGENHPKYLTHLSNLASTYSSLGQYKNALDLKIKVTEKQIEVLGENHPDYLSDLIDISIIYSKLGELDKAMKYITPVIEKQKKILGENHPNYLISLNNFASIYLDLGQFEKALEINMTITEKMKELLGNNHPDYLSSLSNLAGIYSDLGQYEKALEINITIAGKRKELLGKNHPDYLTSLNNLASNYSDLGQYEKSLEINIQVEKNLKELLGENHPDYLISVSNLASSYSDLGHYAKAQELITSLAEKQKEILGENHPDYLLSLNNLASTYSSLGLNDKALELKIKVAEKQKEVLGENHPNYLVSLSNLGSSYSKLRQYKKAFEFDLTVLEKQKQFLGENHPDYLVSLGNLASTYDQLDETISAYTYYRKVTDSHFHLIDEKFNVLTEIEKENYIKKFQKYFSIFQSFSKRNYAEFSTLANDNFWMALNIKGKILRSTVNTINNIKNNKDSTILVIYNDWIMYKKMIDKQSLLPKTERSKSFDNLVDYANILERQLVKASTYMEEQKKGAQIGTQDVYQHLEQNEVAIEFINYRYNDKYRWTDSVYYAAFVITKADTSPLYIPLFEEKQLDSLLTKKGNRESVNINALYKNKKLFDLIWKPLIKYVEKGSTIYCSPSGLLNQIHIASVMDSDSTYLSDSYHFCTMSTTGKIALPKTDKSPKSIAVFGGMRYDIVESELTQQINTLSNNSDLVSRSYFASDSSRSGNWAYLPGTLEEANNILHLAKQEKLDIKSYIGAAGIEENFKNLVPNESPSIIHIATHGFFFPDPKQDLKKLNNQMFGENRFVASDNVLNRSGLLFSGANKAWSGDSPITAREDGILTALEVTSMSLLNTELVVLSACETGLGTIKGSEGVYGLQRAFMTAGTKYLMMSLWKVPDFATQEFMTTFYTELLTNKLPIRSAYSKTQSFMKAKYRNEPYKWAGFVLIE